MQIINFYAAWVGISLGFIAGAVIGLFFHDDKWLGRLFFLDKKNVTLGHISFFGIAFINLIYQ